MRLAVRKWRFLAYCMVWYYWSFATDEVKRLEGLLKSLSEKLRKSTEKIKSNTFAQLRLDERKARQYANRLEERAELDRTRVAYVVAENKGIRKKVLSISLHFSIQ